MGTFERVAGADGRYALSLVKWGFLRRAIVSVLYKISKPNRFKQPTFVPAFELAVFPGSSLNRPVVLIHFSDRDAAQRGWDSVLAAMRERGLKGATDYVCKIRISEMREFGNIYSGAL